MVEFIKWLSNNSVATGALIVVFGIVVFIYLFAFFQGREISFWPPKIGAKPEKARDNISLKVTSKKRIEKLKFEEVPREWKAQIWKSDQGWHVENIEVYCTVHNLRLQVKTGKEDSRDARSNVLTTSFCSECQREGRCYQEHFPSGFALHSQFGWQSFAEEIKSQFIRKIELEKR